jgi:hypothetical protein
LHSSKQLQQLDDEAASLNATNIFDLLVLAQRLLAHLLALALPRLFLNFVREFIKMLTPLDAESTKVTRKK